MEAKIRKMYMADCAIILLFIIGLCSVLVYITSKVAPLVSEISVLGAIFIAFALVIIFGTASSIAVLSHLKKNQRQIYLPEIICYKNINNEDDVSHSV